MLAPLYNRHGARYMENSIQRPGRTQSHGDLKAKEMDLEDTSLTIFRKSQPYPYPDLKPQLPTVVR